MQEEKRWHQQQFHPLQQTRRHTTLLKRGWIGLVKKVLPMFAKLTMIIIIIVVKEQNAGTFDTLAKNPPKSETILLYKEDKSKKNHYYLRDFSLVY